MHGNILLLTYIHVYRTLLQIINIDHRQATTPYLQRHWQLLDLANTNLHIYYPRKHQSTHILSKKTPIYTYTIQENTNLHIYYPRKYFDAHRRKTARIFKYYNDFYPFYFYLSQALRKLPLTHLYALLTKPFWCN